MQTTVYGDDLLGLGHTGTGNCFILQNDKEIRMNDFVQGFIKGARETPRGFFAPAIFLWRLFIGSYNSVIQEESIKNG